MRVRSYNLRVADCVKSKIQLGPLFPHKVTAEGSQIRTLRPERLPTHVIQSRKSPDSGRVGHSRLSTYVPDFPDRTDEVLDDYGLHELPSERSRSRGYEWCRPGDGGTVRVMGSEMIP